jgi:hypothetical protein
MCNYYTLIKNISKIKYREKHAPEKKENMRIKTTRKRRTID